MKINEVLCAMLHYYEGDPARIHHFLKVHSFARAIGLRESLSPDDLFILECAALVHDIGIKASEEKYGSCAGPYQEQEGPPIAKAMLEGLGIAGHAVNRVCYLVAHHHTYSGIKGLDYQILVEADFLVNIFEEPIAPDQVPVIREKIFRTKTGLEFLDACY